MIKSKASKLTLIALSVVTALCNINTAVASIDGKQVSPSYAIVDTNQSQCFGTTDQEECPSATEAMFGQDAQYQGNQPSYIKHDNGTVSDQVTGLMWSQTTDINGDGKINAQDKLTFEEAVNYIKNLKLAGYSDWRLPTIKELYSLTLFDGQDPSGVKLNTGKSQLIPFIDHEIFGVNTGDTKSGERLIDSQFVTSTKYVSTTMHGDDTVFGVNFIDGRIKGYGTSMPDGSVKTFYVLAVRDNPDYGKNDFVKADNGTIVDQATSLVWQQNDSATTMNFTDALGYCESLSVSGNNNWRLPNVKELQSIVDYTRSPDTSSSAAIDPLFNSTAITNEGGKKDYANYWSSTTHVNLKDGENATYVSFGRATGFMNGQWLDVHGAGSQRSDPKVGDASQYPQGHGPQGDSIRINNMVRCVSGGDVTFNASPEYQARAAMTIENMSTESTSEMPMKKSPLTMMDTNGDGKISFSEARGPLKEDFKRLDKNKDGFLTKDEIPSKQKRD